MVTFKPRSVGAFSVAASIHLSAPARRLRRDGPRLATTRWAAGHGQLINLQSSLPNSICFRMLQRSPAGFIAPCLPTKTDKLPSGSQWLHEIKHDGFQSPGIRFNEHIEGDGPTVFAHACKMGLEGIVSKRKDSAYRSGRSPDWLKMKNPDAPAVTREAEEDWAR